MSWKGTTPPHENRLLADQASIQPGQHNTRTTSQPRSHGRKVQLPLHKKEVKQLWRPTNTTPADTQLQGLWPEHPKVRHWKTGLAGDQ
ncbi:hypothetical protein Taro_050298 [Colocasia esculenta]|uniref:Uncharacterized protein n=1 Tax=Colocasia esculenta TaxID=4460 RepID=A0A843XDK2_COLES|nr:hypothetical protein [Colocasia esculenta]